MSDNFKFLSHQPLKRQNPNIPSYWDYWDKITHDCIYTNSTHILNCTWNDTSGYLTRVNLQVTRTDNIHSEIYCNNTSTASSGNLMCNYGPPANYTFLWNFWGEFK